MPQNEDDCVDNHICREERHPNIDPQSRPGRTGKQGNDLCSGCQQFIEDNGN